MIGDLPLVYPDHYPPTGWRERFFIGVRWLGPDLSFFKNLRATQASRTSASMHSWGGGPRQELATVMGAIFARRLRWPTAFFLPNDIVCVIAGGPSFGMLANDPDVLDAIGEIEEQIGVKMPRQFWQGASLSPLGSVVDQLLAAKSGT